MPETTTWILVCDASRARLFAETGPGRAFSLLASFEHPSSREHVRELMADANGRKPVGGSRGAGVNGRPGGFHGRPGAEPDTDPKEVETYAKWLSAGMVFFMEWNKKVADAQWQFLDLAKKYGILDKVPSEKEHALFLGD